MSAHGSRLRRSLLALLSLSLAACGPAEAGSASREAPAPGGETVDSSAGADDRAAILFLGNSLTAGLGVDPNEAFPALLQARLDSAGLPYRVVNAGVSGETSAGGLRRIDFLLEPEVEVLVLALGANDALRGVRPETTRRNLQAIIDRTRERCPACRIVVAGMLAPPNLGPTYTRAFREIFPDLARRNGTALVPFLLEGVGGERSLNQPDGIHPTAEGHEVVAATVWPVLREVLEP